MHFFLYVSVAAERRARNRTRATGALLGETTRFSKA